MSENEAKKVVLGVTGCIGAYKAADIVRSLRKKGIRVQVIMTRAAQEFVTPMTLETLSEEPVITDLWGATREEGVRHISLTEECDVFLVAPATANILAKLAYGMADDFLTTFALACRAPLLIAPAMNTNMFEHPAVTDNMDLLRRRGAEFIAPGDGWLACGWMGKGRLAEPADIVSRAISRLSYSQDLSGYKLVVSAGPTAEALDPIRVLTNRSSGKMGYRIAEAARDRGAVVRLVSGPSSESTPSGVDLRRVDSAVEMQREMNEAVAWCDALLMSAAVADYRPSGVASQKIKKTDGPMTLTLERNPDILLGLKAMRRPEQVVVGFAAETESMEENAKSKLEAKGLDLIVGNDVSTKGAGFGTDNNEATIYSRESPPQPIEMMSKRQMAEVILTRVAKLLDSRMGRKE